MSESSLFFDGHSKLHATLRDLTKRLDEFGISYVVIGGMALTAHGYARMTEDIDILITRPELKKLHEKIVGLGYRREFAGAKNLRDTNTLVKIEFVLTGDYPGSGKVQPISFPNPSDTDPVVLNGVKFIGLARLVELKLASGMTGGADRAKDLVDVQQLIKTLSLPRTFSSQVHEYARAKYEELWDGLRATEKRYALHWRNKFLTLKAKSLDEMIAALDHAAQELREMKADGVILDPEGGTADDYARLISTDPEVARKYGMHEESEFFGDEDEGESEQGT
jgi:Nucleotidyl transferase AbiEii toxin, Type IV TA system